MTVSRPRSGRRRHHSPSCFGGGVGCRLCDQEHRKPRLDEPGEDERGTRQWFSIWTEIPASYRWTGQEKLDQSSSVNTLPLPPCSRHPKCTGADHPVQDLPSPRRPSPLPACLLAFLGAEKVKGDEVQVEHRRVFRGRRVKEVEEPPLLRTPFLFLPLASFSSPLGTSSLPRCPPLESTASPPPPFSTLASDIF